MDARAPSQYGLLGTVLPFANQELEFLERLNGRGEIEPSLLTTDTDLHQRIALNPGLLWKALNVKKHIGKDPSAD